MSFDDNILLKLRREFSGQEKYRLFLQQLDRLERELMKERKKYTELLKIHEETKAKNKALNLRVQAAQAAELELSEYKATEQSKNFVRMKAYKRMEQDKVMWETRFWELHRELQQLKSSSKTTDNG